MKTRPAVAIVVSAIVLALLGNGDGVAQTGGSAAPVKLKLAYVPVGSYPYVWRARDAGYFKAEGLDVTLVAMVGGAAIIPAIEAGELQFGGADVLSVINAVNSGLDLRYVIVPAYVSAKSPVHGMVTNDPQVTKPSDLVGKTVAVNLRYNIEWLLAREWLRQRKVDPEKVTFVEVPFPDMVAAVGKNAVTAAGVAEPFYTLSKDRKYRVLGQYWAEVQEKIAASGIVARKSYIDKNADVTVRLVRALERAAAELKATPELARDLVAANTKTPPAMVARMALMEFEPVADEKYVKIWFDLAVKEGLLDKAKGLGMKDIMWEGAKRQ